MLYVNLMLSLIVDCISCRRVEDIRAQSGYQLEHLQRQQSSMVRRYEAELDQLQTHVSQLEDELDSRNNTLTRE